MRQLTRGSPNPLHFTLGKRLLEARKAAGILPTYLSKDAGLSNNAVFRIEHEGRVPGIDAVERLGAVLRLSPCYLAYGIAGPPLPPSDELHCAGMGARLQQAREQAGLDKAALGKKAKISGQTVANIEMGRNIPSVATAEALSRALGRSPCWICWGLGSEADPYPPLRRKRLVRSKPAAPRRAVKKPARRPRA